MKKMYGRSLGLNIALKLMTRTGNDCGFEGKKPSLAGTEHSAEPTHSGSRSSLLVHSSLLDWRASVEHLMGN
jgi:hypothetical protein